jgi:hypothetical protein
MADFTVYAWGYGDSVANALQGVAMLFGNDGTFYGVAKVAALIGFIATLLAYFSARATADPLRIVKFYVVFIGVVSLFFGITTNVQVHDKALNQTYVVQRVPYPVAYVLSFITQVEDAIARAVDSAFGVGVHYCGSQNMGIFACSQIMVQASDMRVVDPYLYLNLTNFFQDCVFTNILDGSLDAHQLETSNYLYGLIFSNLHPVRFTVLYGKDQCTYPCSAPCGGGCSMSCVDAGAYLRSALYQWVNTQGLNALSAAVGQTVLADLLNTVPSNVMRVSQTGTGFLMQAVLMNQFKETYSSWAASQGMGLTEQGLFTKGQIEKASANRYLPLINGILHVLFASLVPVLVIFMLTPLMRGAMMLAFTFGLWMIVWKFAEAVVNGFFYSKLLGNFYNFAQQGGWDFNVLHAPVVSALLVDHISLGGSLYWLVPTVSFMIASLGGYAFHSFATGLGGIVQGTAQSSAGDVARGSFNAGQVNYRNVSAGTTSLGNFSGWTTSAFTQSVDQGNVGNITRRGNYVQVSGGRIEDVMGLAWQARANGDRAGFMALQAARLALGKDAQVVDFEADTKGGVLGFTVIGKDGRSISYRPGEGGTGVLSITQNGKTITTKVNSDGSIEGITTGKLSEGIVAMFGQSLAQSWAQELGKVMEDSKLVSELISQSHGIKDAEGLRKFYDKVREAQRQARTEDVKEVLNRILEATENMLRKERGVDKRSTTGEESGLTQTQGAGWRAQAGVNFVAGIDKKGGEQKQKGGEKDGYAFQASARGFGGGGFFAGEQINDVFRSFSIDQFSVYNTTSRTQSEKQAKEKSQSDAQRSSDVKASGTSIRDGLSYYAEHGSVEEFMNAVSKTLQYAQKDLESYKKSLQATDSAELKTALLPKMFNQLKQEEAQKLQNSGLSKEEIEVKAAMNALARLDDMIEKNPKELFKYLNSVSGLPDAEKVKRDVEENVPQKGTVGNPPPELRQQIENAEKKLNSEYSLTVSAGKDIKQAQKLASTLSKATGREAQIIRTDKGYMVRVGGFKSEDLVRGLAQGLGLKNYRIEKVEPPAENMLKDQYSLNVFAGKDINKVDRLAQALSKATEREAQVIKTDKGYMVSVGGFQSEEEAKGLAKTLRLNSNSYRIEKVEPPQQPQPQQQQPPAPAKK